MPPRVETGAPPQGPEGKFIQIRTKEALKAIVDVNPGTGIVSVTKYNQYFGTPEQRGRGETEFRPWRFHPPEFVDVEIKRGVVRKLLIDGHHRTVGVYDNFETIQEKYPYFFAEPDPSENPPLNRFRLYDATEDTLNNPSIVDQASKGDRTVLTMDEYLIAVLVPTLEQEEIAPRRIAAKLMLGWNSMVGEELAAKFSGLAALSFLQDPNLRFRDKRALQIRVGEIKNFFKDNTESEKREIRNSLVSLGMVIKRAETESTQSGRQIRKEDIAAAAFELIGENSGALGTSEEIQQQVDGLLYHPEIQQKLVQRYGPGDALIQGIQDMGAQLAIAIKRHTRTRSKNDELGHIQRSLIDPRFTLDDAMKVVIAEKPSKEYIRVDQLVQRRIVTFAYLRAEGEKRRTPMRFEDLTEFELQALRDTPFVRHTGKPGGNTIATSVEHIGIIAKGLQQTAEFSTFLIGVHSSILTPGEKRQLQSRMDFLRTRIMHDSNVARVSTGAEITAIVRETHEKVAAARVKPHSPGNRHTPSDRRLPSPRPYTGSEATEVKMLLERIVRDEEFYRNHRSEIATVSDEDMKTVYRLYEALDTIVKDHKRKTEHKA